MNTFGTSIKAARHKKGFSLAQLAIKIGCTSSYLSKLENGKADTPPSIAAIEALALVLNLDFEQLRRSSGRIDEREWALYTDLFKEYRNFSLLLRKMPKNPNLARQIFALL
jgi:transcriptional regulator with XRE-family HTH domain